MCIIEHTVYTVIEHLCLIETIDVFLNVAITSITDCIYYNIGKYPVAHYTFNKI